jgi:hypothetical protein
VIVPGSSWLTLPENKRVSNISGGTIKQTSAADAQVLGGLITAQRLQSYLRWSKGDLPVALRLYEWNMAASAAVLHTSAMVEVIVRNAMDQALQERAKTSGWSSWLDNAPLDQRGQADIRKARLRATDGGKIPEIHGKVVAELTLGFWRYLTASRYLTTLWTPTLYRAFGYGPVDKRQQRRQIDCYLQALQLVRNRAAHHEPIHRRDLRKDLEAAVEISSWVHPTAGQ